MIIKLLCAAMLGGLVGGAELVACYRDRPGQAVLSPSGLMYVFVNAVAALIALVAIETARFQFGLPDDAPAVSLYVVQVVTAGLGSAALFRTSFTLVQDRGISMGPISLLHGVLKIVDGAMARKRALSRLSGNELEGLSFVRDHAALAQLACHALPTFDLAEAQRLGELAADLRSRADLTDADKLDCFGLELSWLVGDRALAKAADRLRARPEPEEEPGESRDPQEWWLAEEQARPADPRPAPMHAGQPTVRGSLARETRMAAPGGRPGPAEEAGGAGWPGRPSAGTAERSVLETRADMRRPAEAAEPRPAKSSHAGRTLRRSRTAS
jgi:hypothetical protein